jgi:ABC-type multidrug transport system permease subunit
MSEYVIRFVLGGVVVSAFAMLADLLRPKSFAGLFGAAPSVALATLGIAVLKHGAGYASTQSSSMIAGTVALVLYGAVVCHLLMRTRMQALPATAVGTAAWLVTAIGLWAIGGWQA